MIKRKVTYFKGELEKVNVIEAVNMTEFQLRLESLKWEKDVRTYIQNDPEVRVMKIKIKDEAETDWVSFLDQMGFYYKKFYYAQTLIWQVDVPIFFDIKSWNELPWIVSIEDMPTISGDSLWL